jgi:hypothetical protein
MDLVKNGRMKKGQIGCVWPIAPIIANLPSLARLSDWPIASDSCKDYG